MTKAPEKSKKKRVIDVTAEQLARVYAKAAFDAAKTKGTAKDLVEELSELAIGVLDRFPRLEAIFGTELISRDEKQAILDRIFSGRLTESSLGLLQVLTRHNRLDLLRDVIRSVQSLWDKHVNRVPVEVQYAAEPDESLQQEVAETLKTLLGSEPVITTTVDPELVAGFVVQVGDKVYDSSARSDLERIRQSMIARAFEALGQQPDQFVLEK
jgi:F-type H+-transporting ATPase subunit delta